MQFNGLVLCGGKSTRMGEDKSLINYNGDPQYLYCYNLLSKYCNKVYLSCNTSQAERFDPLPCIIDKYDGMGPMEGIRNAFEYEPTANWLIIPCDMPFITKTEIELLIKGRSRSIDAVCFKDKEDINPLFGIWEESCGERLKHYKGDSPKRFLKSLPINVLQANYKSLINVNDQKEKGLIIKSSR
ncbi:MAG TPA: molybdenum cofactor guanylyltransferase [Fulvivirga sp.]|nr:molybdenum cofactor guanylyltransferase [Fulvivirga sp.]